MVEGEKPVEQKENAPSAHHAHEHHATHHHAAHPAEKLSILLIAIVSLIILFNQFQIVQVQGMLVGGSSGVRHTSPPVTTGEGGTLTLGAFTFGSRTTLKPIPLASGEEPAIAGYRTRVKELPTISELALAESTGDAVQDLLNNVIPRGSPWYGQEAQVSFDDPITSQKNWATYEQSIQLSAEENARWQKIVGSFTCDYCCGSPSHPTIITQCGCAHARAARGMAKWFIANYGDTYSNDEVYGELARWYALWYPKGTIQRIIQESSSDGSGGSTSIDSLPSMVGGC